jgi:hypothetical protein
VGGGAEREGRTGPGAPWLAALDPAANLRSLAEIQRRGLEAAGEVIDRLAGSDDDHDDGTVGADQPRMPDGVDLQGLTDLWAELTRRWLVAVAQLAPARSVDSNGHGVPVDGAGASLTVAGSANAPSPLRLTVRHSESDDASIAAETELWLVNETTDERRDLRPHCGELRAHDGGVFPGGPTFEPAVVDVLPGRSSRGLRVAVSLNGNGVSPGTYRGVVLVAGLPGAWLPVEVTVEP